MEAEMPEPIQVWRFEDAPAPYQQLSPHGGDEDWLALVPSGVEQPAWMGSGTPFGWCDVSAHELPDGLTVYIGAHA
jgi:hypothetical protein